MLVSILSQAQTWETTFAEARDEFDKGKFERVLQLTKSLESTASPAVKAWIPIMNSRVHEVIKNYPSMFKSIEYALESLESIKDSDPTAYKIGIVKLADLYSEYGNHKKAYKLINSLDPIDKYNKSSLISNEILLRLATSLLENGHYSKSDSILAELENVWSGLKSVGYKEEPVSEVDISYKNDLEALTKLSRIRILARKGKYRQAMANYENSSASIEKMLHRRSSTFYQFHMLPVEISFGAKDYKAADRYMGQYFSELKSGNAVEQGILQEVKLSFLINDNPGVYNARDYLYKYSNRVGAPKAYREFLLAYVEAVDEFMDRDFEAMDERFDILLSTSTEIVPVDHPMRTLVFETLIDFYKKTERGADLIALSDHFTRLSESLSVRFIDGLHHDIGSLKLSEYLMVYSEDPLKAIEILQPKPYENVFAQLEPTHIDYPGYVNGLKEYFIMQSEYDVSIKLNRNVVEAMKNVEDISPFDLGRQIVSLASVLYERGYYTEAEEKAKEALEIIRKEGDRFSLEYIEALNFTAVLYGQLGDFIQAKDLLRKSRHLARAMGSESRSVLINSIEDLAIINSELGNFSETESLLQDVIKYRSEIFGPVSRSLMKPYNSIGQVYVLKGDYAQAETNIKKSLNIAREVYGESSIHYADNQETLVNLYIQLGNFEEALVNATDLFATRTEQLWEDHIKLARSNTDLAMIKFYMGESISIVEDHLAEAQRIILKNFNEFHPLNAEALKNLAYLKLEEGELDKALDLLSTADEIWAQSLGNLNIGSGEVARVKGDIYTIKGEFELAKEQYEKASQYFQKIFSKEHPEYLKTQSKLAQSYFISGNLEEVRDILEETTSSYLNYTVEHFPTLTEDEKAKFWSKIKSDFEFYNSVAIASIEDKEKYLSNMYNFALLTKGMLLNSSIKTRNIILNSGDSSLIKTFEDWVAKKELLTASLSQTEEALNDDAIDLKFLRNEISSLEKELNRKSSDFEKGYKSKSYGWTDVKEILKENEAAIEIIRYRNFDTGFNEDQVRYAALIVTSETKLHPELVLLENGTEMEGGMFKGLGNSIRFRVKTNIPYEIYWKEISAKLQGKDIVYLSPDGVYNQINIESLSTPNGGYVIDKANIRVVGNTRSIVESRTDDSKDDKPNLKNALLFGNPRYYSEENTIDIPQLEEQTRAMGLGVVAQLPGAETEVNLINDILKENNWKVNLAVGEAATEELIKTSKDLSVVHIATHGFFDEKPSVSQEKFDLFNVDNPLERSGILTSGGGDVVLSATKNYNIFDGVLTAYEAMNLNFDKTELVILSACETGRGEIEQGEGIFGLQRSFLVAGADALIMSLFKVSDEVTQQLMVEFYKNWISGLSKRDAFNKAQLTIKEAYPEPIYWGSFMMVGTK